MLISKNWLLQYLPENIKVSDTELKEKISVALAEIENMQKIGEKLKNIVVGEIKQIKPHPKSSKLQLTIVDIGQKRKNPIVCAASNIFEGAKIPVALPGGIVLNPEQETGKQDICIIKEITILKVKSRGMLCSQKELGISNDHTGIWILPDEVKVGENFVKLISDTVLEIENKALTHRPDCFSHLGIAREISTIIKSPFDYKESEELLIPTETLPLVVKIENKTLCKRYTAIAIQGVKIKPSPLWLQLKLLACGVRPINNVVDATNYVMLDLGQPLHAFDYNKLNTPRIIVRTARPRENTTTLDGEKRSLKKTHLLICDPGGPIGIAGIMGSLNSEIYEDTRDIVIESANFEMYNIRRTSRELGIRSEASTRFEKGLDPNLTLPALRQVVQLITDIAGGEVASEVFDFYPEPIKEKTLEIQITDVPRLLGIDLQKKQIMDILQALQLEIQSPETSTNNIKVIVPTFRKDLNIKEDLLEEIARIYGYDKFKPTLPKRNIQPAKLNQKRQFEKSAKLTLTTLGFDEIYTYSFTGEESYKKTLLDIKECIQLRNPISPELGYMRNSIIPNILEKVQPNIVNFEEISFFEIARIFQKEKNKEKLPKQPKHIAGVLCLSNQSLKGDNSPEDRLFYILKGKIETLMEKLNIKRIKFEKEQKVEYLYPGKQAKILVNNIQIGSIGIIHPEVKINWNIKQNTAIFVLDFEKVFKNTKETKKYTNVSKFPQVSRDLSFWINKDIEANKILESLQNTKCKFVKEIKITDIYLAKGKKNQKSITIKIKLQSTKSTLSEKNINTDIKTFIKTIEKLGGKIRKQ